MSRRKALTAVILVLTCWLAVQRVIIVPWGAPGVDYPKHYVAARRVLAGQSPYTGGDMYLSFNYPQFVAWLNLPLAFFKSAEAAEPFWDIANIILVLLSAAIVAFGYRPGRSRVPADSVPVIPWDAAALFAFFFFAPTSAGLRPGNLSSWDLLFITLAGWAIVRGREPHIGAFIALSSLIKLLPVLLLVPYVFAGRKKVLQGAAAVYGSYLLLLILTGGLENEWFYATRVIPHIGGYWVHVSYSIPHGLTRVFAPDIHADKVLLARLSVIWNILLILPYILMCALRRRLASEEGGRVRLLVFGCVLLPLMPPLLEYVHFVWVLPGLAAALFLQQTGRLTRGETMTLFVGFFGIAVAGPLADVLCPWNISPLLLAPLSSLMLFGYIVWRLVWRPPLAA